MIEAEGLTKRFRDIVAMDRVSFRANDGRVTGLVGLNGAGKSTTLRVLCTVIKADGGHARVDGVNVAASRWPSADRSARCPIFPGCIRI